jgi:NitT/TauT family transport system substrate-binding protein
MVDKIEFSYEEGLVPSSRLSTRFRRAFVSVVGVVLLAAVAACSSSSQSTTAASAGSGKAGNAAPVTVRLGYFPNITHAPAIVGVEKEFFQQALGQNKLQTATFNAGPEAVDALFSDSIDAAFVGPNPAVNAFQKSNGEAIRIVSGSTSGGAGLVVKPSITSPADLKGRKIATPQLGNTQDVALRAYLKSQGFDVDTSGGGDVSIVPQANADTLTQFATGDIDGAWVPEPFFTRMQQENGGKILVDERTLWPNGRFVTTQLVVATKFLNAHPDVVLDLIKGEAQAIELINDSPADAQKITNDGIARISGKPLKDSVVNAAFGNMAFTLDPIAPSLKKSAQDAKDVGLLDNANVQGIYDLSQLNQYLKTAGQPQVQG